MLELSLKSVGKYYNVTKVLENVTFDAKTGDRIGLIGRNGSGKTTIFKMIVGLEPHDGGNIIIRKDARVGYLDQIPEYDEIITVESVIKEALAEHYEAMGKLREMELQMSALSGVELDRLMSSYSKVQDKFISLGGYEMEEWYNRIVQGFNFSEEFLIQSFEKLSGGEKTSVLLAKILLTKPDILLLDEPSNHLDTHAIHWLEDYLKSYEGTVITISHDRYFLDNIVNKIVEVEHMVTEEYHGNYTYYVEEKERRIAALLEAYKNQEKKIKAMKEAIQRFYAWSHGGQNEDMIAKARNMEKRIERMDKIDRPKVNHRKARIQFSSSDRSANEALVLSDISKSFGDKDVLKKVDMDIRFGEFVGLLGKNGSGKSTIFKIIMDRMTPDSGTKNIGSRVKIAYLDQNVEFENENMTVIEMFRDIFECKEIEARSKLAGSLFFGEDVFKKVSSLSGGEKTRLKLCILMNSDVNFLLFDEPTNHLDIDSREMLELALESFKGTMLFISHDRYFINKIADRIDYLEDGSIKSYIGGYDYFLEKFINRPNNDSIQKLRKDMNNVAEFSKTESSKKPTDDSNKDLSNKNSGFEDKSKDDIKPKKKNTMKINLVEEELSRLEENLEDISKKIIENSSNYVQLQELNTEKEYMEIKIIELMEQLEELNS